MARQSYSLRWRIIRLVSIPVLVSGLMIGVLALYTAWHEIEEVYDAQLVHAAKVLRQLTLHELAEHESGLVNLIPQSTDLGYKYEKHIAFRIWSMGKSVIESENAAIFSSSIPPAGLTDQMINGEKWRFFVLPDQKGQLTIETAERYSIRYEPVEYLLLGLLLPASIFIPVVLVLIWYGASRGLKPLAELSADVQSRNSDDLRRIEPERVPEEISSLVDSLNRLLKNLEDTIQREREFTDNAAHELRTPLAAIKTQAQAMQRSMPEETTSVKRLSNLLNATDRATQMVDQLLAFARLQKSTPKHTDVDLRELLTDCVAGLSPSAVDKNQQLSLMAKTTVRVKGDQHALGIMFNNLIENAIKYTPVSGSVEISLELDNHNPKVIVCDSGPGIPDNEKQRVFSRFHRIAGSEIRGSGLGLAIVNWIAQQHGVNITLSDNQPHGLICTLTFNSITV